jgi:hypothetical protein
MQHTGASGAFAAVSGFSDTMLGIMSDQKKKEAAVKLQREEVLQKTEFAKYLSDIQQGATGKTPEEWGTEWEAQYQNMRDGAVMRGNNRYEQDQIAQMYDNAQTGQQEAIREAQVYHQQKTLAQDTNDTTQMIRQMPANEIRLQEIAKTGLAAQQSQGWDSARLDQYYNEESAKWTEDRYRQYADSRLLSGGAKTEDELKNELKNLPDTYLQTQDASGHVMRIGAAGMNKKEQIEAAKEYAHNKTYELQQKNYGTEDNTVSGIEEAWMHDSNPMRSSEARLFYPSSINKEIANIQSYRSISLNDQQKNSLIKRLEEIRDKASGGDPSSKAEKIADYFANAGVNGTDNQYARGMKNPLDAQTGLKQYLQTNLYSSDEEFNFEWPKIQEYYVGKVEDYLAKIPVYAEAASAIKSLKNESVPKAYKDNAQGYKDKKTEWLTQLFSETNISALANDPAAMKAFTERIKNFDSLMTGKELGDILAGAAKLNSSSGAFYRTAAAMQNPDMMWTDMRGSTNLSVPLAVSGKAAEAISYVNRMGGLAVQQYLGIPEEEAGSRISGQRETTEAGNDVDAADIITVDGGTDRQRQFKISAVKKDKKVHLMEKTGSGWTDTGATVDGEESMKRSKAKADEQAAQRAADEARDREWKALVQNPHDPEGKLSDTNWQRMRPAEKEMRAKVYLDHKRRSASGGAK